MKSGILLHNRNKIKLKVEKEEKIKNIPIVEKYKYLGVYIDSRLTFED